jgi:hypothetical protein
MKKIIIIVIIFTGILMYTSCDSNTYGEVSVVENPTYTKNIGPLFDSRCTGCHKNNEQFPNLQTYVQVKEAVDEGDVLCKIDNPAQCNIDNTIMPPSGRMQQSTIDMVKKWKEQGFAN